MEKKRSAGDIDQVKVAAVLDVDVAKFGWQDAPSGIHNLPRC